MGWSVLSLLWPKIKESTQAFQIQGTLFILARSIDKDGLNEMSPYKRTLTGYENPGSNKEQMPLYVTTKRPIRVCKDRL